MASTYGRGIWNYELVTSPSYTNVISNSPQTVFPTQNATFDGTLTAQNGYASPVNLSCTGEAPATCTLQPTQATFSGNPTATYTLTAGGVVGDYSFNAHAVGTDGNAITHNTPVTLHVVDFNLTAPSPNSLSVAQGGTSGASTFQVTAAGSFAGTVTLSCSAGLPTGVACVFSPSSSASPTSSAPVTVTLTVTAAAGTPVGGPTTVTISAMATGAPAAKTQTFGLTVTGSAADFTWTDTGSATATVLAGQSASYTFSAAPVGGGPFSSALSFGCGNLPALASCTFTPPSIPEGAGTTAVTLTIATTGPNSGTQLRPQVRAVLSTAWTLRLRSGQALGGGRPYPIMWVALVGIAGVGRKRRGKPRLYGGIAGICLALGLMALISCGGVAVGGGGGGTPNFAITMTLTPGSTVVNQNVQWNGMLTASTGYSGTVAMTCTAGAPTTCGFAPQIATPTTAGTPFAVTLGSATTGTFNFTITGTDGTLTHATTTETLMVTPLGPPPDFAIAVTATPNTTVVNQDVTWNGTLTALNEYVSGVNLSCTPGAPATCEITPPNQVAAASGAPYTVKLGSATAGTFNFTIQGTDGTLTHATPVETLTVETNAAVTVSPASATLFANEPGNSWPAGGNQQQFTANQSVTWAVTGGGANGTIDGTGMYTPPAMVPNPATVTVTATPATGAAPGSAFLTVAAPTALGTSQITVTATAAGGAAHGDVVTLIVR